MKLSKKPRENKEKSSFTDIKKELYTLFKENEVKIALSITGFILFALAVFFTINNIPDNRNELKPAQLLLLIQSLGNILSKW